MLLGFCLFCSARNRMRKTDWQSPKKKRPYFKITRRKKIKLRVFIFMKVILNLISLYYKFYADFIDMAFLHPFGSLRPGRFQINLTL